MKIGTLLTAAIVSLSTIGGGLAVYVAVSKYQTMDKVSVAQSRLEVVRAVGDIPRYMNPERGFATNILLGSAVVDPKMMTSLDKYRKDTDGALYHTYSTYSRGLDMLNGAYHYLDLVPKGRDEDKLAHHMEWVRLRDEYV